MSRKFLNKKSDELDDRKIELTKTESKETTPYEELKTDLVSANKQIHSIANYLGYQTMKIEKIKRMHDDFERQLDMLNADNDQIVIAHQAAKTEFESLGHEFDAKKIIGNITSIVEKQGTERITSMEKQLIDEKEHIAQFNKKLQQNLVQFSVMEEALKSDKSKLESIIREKTEQLVNAERMSAIGELASRLAHDMKNPLTAIKGSIQLIKKVNQDKLDDFSIKRIEVIESSIFRMTHQIDNVLDFIKDAKLNITQASLTEIFVSSIENIRVPQNITLKLPNSDFTISCDAQKLSVAFSNIILNAIQAMEMQKGTITINATRDNSHLVIEVTDSGPGIPADVLPRIFDPLFTTKQIGTGLGLSSCKKIIEQHHGTIGVTNNPTKFSIILPL
ncbi:MAG: GHKL domain-containing protein [Thaumarchaeota archaeon]|nr:GHKL domain-containing protein [Nitrososphaerota archaeon]